MIKKTYFNWSSGKDSALALHYLLKDKTVKVDRLLTTVNAHYNRVSMHGLRREVLLAQADSIGISLDIIDVPESPTMEDYNEIMCNKIDVLRRQDYTHCVFGDIFLEDLRAYREKMLLPYDIEALFPIWKRETYELVKEFLMLGYRAIIVCIDNSKLDESFLGEELSLELIKRFPKEVDPCGENGEYHTFCFDGPIFNKKLSFSKGEKIFRTYGSPSKDQEDIKFGFCDILIK